MKGAGQWQPQHFLYEPQGQLLGVYDGDTGDIREELLYFGTIPVATIRDGAVYYIHTDHLGTPRLISDRNQSVLWRWHSDPFGKSQPNQDPDGDGTDFVFNLRFPGQYYDSETNLHYNYFRYYDPELGRYITSDPIGLNGGINTYTYALNNPIILYDPYGLWVPPSLPQSVVDGAAGFGDGLSGGITNWIRDQAGINGSVDKCSSIYSGSQTTGAVTSLSLGLGRLAYAGLARGYSATASSGAAASTFRSQLRVVFGGGRSLRPPNLSRYRTDAALRAAAGRTNASANAAGVAAVAAGANGLANNDECECQ